MTYSVYYENTDGVIMAVDDLSAAEEKLKKFPRKYAKLRKCVVTDILSNATHIREYYDAGVVEYDGATL